MRDLRWVDDIRRILNTGLCESSLSVWNNCL